MTSAVAAVSIRRQRLQVIVWKLPISLTNCPLARPPTRVMVTVQFWVRVRGGRTNGLLVRLMGSRTNAFCAIVQRQSLYVWKRAQIQDLCELWFQNFRITRDTFIESNVSTFCIFNWSELVTFGSASVPVPCFPCSDQRWEHSFPAQLKHCWSLWPHWWRISHDAAM